MKFQSLFCISLICAVVTIFVVSRSADVFADTEQRTVTLEATPAVSTAKHGDRAKDAKSTDDAEAEIEKVREAGGTRLDLTGERFAALEQLAESQLLRINQQRLRVAAWPPDPFAPVRPQGILARQQRIARGSADCRR